jgi:hypothetical protein
MRSVFCFISALFLCISNYGILFEGTITYTFTKLDQNVPELSLGNTFFGTYRYESETLDTSIFSGPVLPLITGSVYIPSAFNRPYLGSGGEIEIDRNPSLTVQNGKITSLMWHTDITANEINFDTATFLLVRHSGEELYRGSGTVIYSDPKAVPETGTTFWMFVTGMAMVSLVNRRLQRARRDER